MVLATVLLYCFIGLMVSMELERIREDESAALPLAWGVLWPVLMALLLIVWATEKFD